MLGYVHDRQPTIILQVSLSIRRFKIKRMRIRGKSKSVTVVLLFCFFCIHKLCKHVSATFCYFQKIVYEEVNHYNCDHFRRDGTRASQLAGVLLWLFVSVVFTPGLAHACRRRSQNVLEAEVAK